MFNIRSILHSTIYHKTNAFFVLTLYVAKPILFNNENLLPINPCKTY